MEFRRISLSRPASLDLSSSTRLECDCIRDLAKKSGTLVGSGTIERTSSVEREPFLLSLGLGRLLPADFDLDVTAIAAQPFLLRAQVSGRARVRPARPPGKRHTLPNRRPAISAHNPSPPGGTTRPPR